MTDHVTSTGLSIPTIEELQADTEQDQRNLVDSNIDTTPESPMGEVNSIVNNQLREAWEALAIAYNGFNPDAAEGFLLEALCAITGTVREKATASYFRASKARPVALTIQANKTIPKGTVFSQDGNPNVKFALDVDVVSTTAGVYYSDATCLTKGPISCNAHTLIIIDTPVNGLDAVDNPFDAYVGTAEDDDPTLRQRRERELRQEGRGTVGAIRAAVYAISINGAEPVISADVFENETDWTDLTTGLPPHSLEVLMFDGLSLDVPNDTIAQTIWDTKPGGIQMVGLSTGNAIDDAGVTRVVKFTRPTQSECFVNISIKIDSVAYAGDPGLKDAIKAAFTQRPNQNISWSSVVKVAMNYTGVSEITTVTIGFLGSSPPAFTDISIGLRQIGYVQTSHITINHV